MREVLVARSHERDDHEEDDGDQQIDKPAQKSELGSTHRPSGRNSGFAERHRLTPATTVPLEKAVVTVCASAAQIGENEFVPASDVPDQLPPFVLLEGCAAEVTREAENGTVWPSPHLSPSLHGIHCSFGAA